MYILRAGIHWCQGQLLKSLCWLFKEFDWKQLEWEFVSYVSNVSVPVDSQRIHKDVW